MKQKINYLLLGKRIHEWRMALGITQENLAYMTDVSVPFISALENGKKKPSLETVISIADAMGITVDEIMAGNQLSSPNDYQSDIDILLHDCSSEERRFLYESLKSLKDTIRQNRWFIHQGQN